MFRVRLLLLAVPLAGLAIAAVALVASDGGTASSGAGRPRSRPGIVRRFRESRADRRSLPRRAASAIHWSLCAPPGTGACDPIPSTDGIAHPGPQPAGTVFKVTATYRTDVFEQRDLARPFARSLAGPGWARAFRRDGRGERGQLGGWLGDRERPARDRSLPDHRATSCVMLSGEELQCRRGSVRVPRRRGGTAQATQPSSRRELVHRLVPVRARRASREHHFGSGRVLVASGDPPMAYERDGDPLKGLRAGHRTTSPARPVPPSRARSRNHVSVAPCDAP